MDNKINNPVAVEERLYRWVKANERLPEKEDNYFVNVSGVESDNDNAEYTCGAYHHFVDTFQGKYFSSLPANETVIEWLEEIPIKEHLPALRLDEIIVKYWEYATTEAEKQYPDDVVKGSHYREGIFKGIFYCQKEHLPVEDEKDKLIKELQDQSTLLYQENVQLLQAVKLLGPMVEDGNNLLEDVISKTFYDGKRDYKCLMPKELYDKIQNFLNYQPTLLEDQALKEDDVWDELLDLTIPKKLHFIMNPVEYKESKIPELKKQFSIKKL